MIVSETFLQKIATEKPLKALEIPDDVNLFYLSIIAGLVKERNFLRQMLEDKNQRILDWTEQMLKDNT